MDEMYSHVAMGSIIFVCKTFLNCSSNFGSHINFSIHGSFIQLPIIYYACGNVGVSLLRDAQYRSVEDAAL